MKNPSHGCYCAFCRAERRVYGKKHLSAGDVFVSLIASVLLNFILWQTIDPRVAVLFALALMVVEVFVLLRWRLSLPCRSCGFDVLLYKRSPKLAAERVKNYMEARKADPYSVFVPRPRLPVIVKKRTGDSRVHPVSTAALAPRAPSPFSRVTEGTTR